MSASLQPAHFPFEHSSHILVSTYTLCLSYPPSLELFLWLYNFPFLHSFWFLAQNKCAIHLFLCFMLEAHSLIRNYQVCSFNSSLKLSPGIIIKLNIFIDFLGAIDTWWVLSLSLVVSFGALCDWQIIRCGVAYRWGGRRSLVRMGRV